jgi:hypothetical protein
MDGFESPPGAYAAGPASASEIVHFAVEAAVHAPSVHNIQPWWFGSGDLGISIHADAERQLRLADPDGREVMISCGAAVFTTRVALRYLGVTPDVRVLPEPDLPNLVARVSWRAAPPPEPYEQRLYAEIRRRHTHRGGFDGRPVPEQLLAALRTEAAREGAGLTLVTDENRQGALAATVEAAEYALRMDGPRAREAAHWAPAPGSSRRDGVVAVSYPARPDHTEPHFPARDFAHGHGWGRPGAGRPGAAAHSAGAVGLLTTSTDAPADWIRAGQSLQRMLLCASSNGAAVALHSQPLEMPLLRAFIREQISAGAWPQMVLRIGTTSQESASVRRPVEEVLL